MKRVYLPAAAIPVGAFVQSGHGEIFVTSTRHDAADRLVILDRKGHEWVFDGEQRVEVLDLPGMRFYGEGGQE